MLPVLSPLAYFYISTEIEGEKEKRQWEEFSLVIGEERIENQGEGEKKVPFY